MSRRSVICAQVVAILVVSAAVACDPQRAQRFYHETFEELCDGTPCGWERSAGTAEQAIWVETLHPGEHGLRLTGEVTVRGPGSTETSASDDLSMDVSVRCDPGSSLSTVVLIDDTTGERTLPASPPGTIVGIGGGDSEWHSRTLYLGPGTGTFNARIVAVVLIKTGAGECEIGDILIRDTIFVPDGC